MGERKRKMEIIDLTDEDSGNHEKKQKPVENPKSEASKDTPIVYQDFYIVCKNDDGAGPSDTEIFGMYQTLEEANDIARNAAKDCLCEGYDGRVEWDVYDENTERDGQVYIRAHMLNDRNFRFYVQKHREKVHQRVASRSPKDPIEIVKVFVVKEEYREWVGSDEGDLKSVDVLGVFKDLHTANSFVQETRDELTEEMEDSREVEEWEEGGLLQITVNERLEGYEWRLSVCAESLR